MAKNSFLKSVIATILLLLGLYAFFTIVVYPSNDEQHSHTLFGSQEKIGNSGWKLDSPGTFLSRPVKIYMYDLPRKFTYGVIESYAMARGGEKGRVNDDALLKYPGNQHSAEWYLFADLTRPDRGADSPVTRVLDPEEADLFYVPFFSSLSLVVNPIRPTNVAVEGPQYSDDEMQENLIEWLGEQVYWKRNNGWDHVFICQDPNALYKIVDRVKNGVFLVSDFGRLGRDQASLVKDVILPYSHRINTFHGGVGVENRKSLLFFMGNRYRKEVIFGYFWFCLQGLSFILNFGINHFLALSQIIVAESKSAD
ncbi:unnamed protein product [Ilex paraguariensis]|uniref:Exostosin GT47 domain-containing protein n=1 Tax=Ilex paraguariensis TaxID=185542 RepID=A0ABC8ULE2_9AQUA